MSPTANYGDTDQMPVDATLEPCFVCLV